MTDENRKAEDESQDVVEGFDLPDSEPVPPPQSALTAEGGPPAAPPLVFEPHVRAAEKTSSILPKLVALIVIPLAAVIVLVLIRHGKMQRGVEYQRDCATTAEKFLKGLSDDTAESVPAAYNLLHKDLRRDRAAEFVTEEYAKATARLGKFKGLKDIRWDEAPPGQASTSFTALAEFEGEPFPVWFRFWGLSDVRISDYRFGTK